MMKIGMSYIILTDKYFVIFYNIFFCNYMRKKKYIYTKIGLVLSRDLWSIGIFVFYGKRIKQAFLYML